MNIYTAAIQNHCIPNKYTKWYLDICLRAQTRITSSNIKEAKAEARKLFGYIECHHIWPKSFCDTRKQKQDFTNFAFLSAREHFICHRLLCKMTNGIYLHKMNNALMLFAKYNKIRLNISSRVYENIRKHHATSASIESKRLQQNGGFTSGYTKIVENGKIIMISTDIFDTDIHISTHKNKIAALDLSTNTNVSVDRSEFENNPNLVGVTKGFIYAVNISTNLLEKCTSVDIKNGTHIHPNRGNKLSLETCKKLSEMRKDKMTAKTFDGMYIRVYKNDPRLLSCEIGTVTAKGYILTSPEFRIYKTLNIIKTLNQLGVKSKPHQVDFLNINETLVFSNMTKSRTILNGWTLTRIL